MDPTNNPIKNSMSNTNPGVGSGSAPGFSPSSVGGTVSSGDLSQQNQNANQLTQASGVVMPQGVANPTMSSPATTSSSVAVGSSMSQGFGAVNSTVPVNPVAGSSNTLTTPASSNSTIMSTASDSSSPQVVTGATLSSSDASSASSFSTVPSPLTETLNNSPSTSVPIATNTSSNMVSGSSVSAAGTLTGSALTSSSQMGSTEPQFPLGSPSASLNSPSPAPIVSNPENAVQGTSVSSSGPQSQPALQTSQAVGVSDGSSPVTSVSASVSPGGLGATDPIMMPEKPKEPDPVEEELKAPLRAMGPVPGSIGSAVSGPSSDQNTSGSSGGGLFGAFKRTPNVSFNDPAEQATPSGSEKKSFLSFKGDKKTLIILISVVAVILIALIIVFVVMLNQPKTSGASSVSRGSISMDDTGQSDDEDSEDEFENPDVSNEDVEVDSSVVCSNSLDTGDGNTEFRTMSVDIADNKIIRASFNVEKKDNQGTTITSDSNTLEMSAFLGEGETSSQFIDDEGKLLISEEELRSKMESGLNQDSDTVYSCILQ